MADEPTRELPPQQEHSREPQPKQLCATHITKITRSNYNRRKENRITVSSRILNHNNLYT
jgi:hypothetical protein